MMTLKERLNQQVKAWHSVQVWKGQANFRQGIKMCLSQATKVHLNAGVQSVGWAHLGFKSCLEHCSTLLVSQQQ